MLARYQSEKAGNVSHISYQGWITQTSDQMRGYDLTDAGQALEPGNRLPQLWILLTVVANLLLRRRRAIDVEMQRPDQLVQLEAHCFRARQLEQLFEHRG